MRPALRSGEAGTPVSAMRIFWLLRDPKISTPDGVVPPLPGWMRTYPTSSAPVPSVAEESLPRFTSAYALVGLPGWGRTVNATDAVWVRDPLVPVTVSG